MTPYHWRCSCGLLLICRVSLCSTVVQPSNLHLQADVFLLRHLWAGVIAGFYMWLAQLPRDLTGQWAERQQLPATYINNVLRNPRQRQTDRQTAKSSQLFNKDFFILTSDAKTFTVEEKRFSHWDIYIIYNIQYYAALGSFHCALCCCVSLQAYSSALIRSFKKIVSLCFLALTPLKLYANNYPCFELKKKHLVSVEDHIQYFQ